MLPLTGVPEVSVVMMVTEVVVMVPGMMAGEVLVVTEGLLMAVAVGRVATAGMR